MDIILDPGHGGHTDQGKSTAYGVRGPSGTLEKDVTLRLARLVAQHLGTNVGMTRVGDDNPTLAARSETARNQNARVFLSLHANQGESAARGAETWVHDRSGPASTNLAASVQRSLARLGGPDRGVRRGQLAVLVPERHAAQTAACLLEVDFLSDPIGERRFGNPNALDAIARAIADGVRGFLQAPAYGSPSFAFTRALDTTNYDNWFNDTSDQNAMNASLCDAAKADTRVVSQKPDAIAVINAFAGRTGSSPWTSLDRGQVAGRLTDLINNPRKLNQGPLNLCGPASFLMVWNKRDPVAFANWATALFENGQASIGSTNIAPAQDLLTANYAQLMGASSATPQADWMVMGAMRNSTSRLFFQPEWRGNPSQVLAGLSQPGEVCDWLRATGLYATVDNQADWTSAAGFNHAATLQPGDGRDIIMMLNTNALINNTPRTVTINPMTQQSTPYNYATDNPCGGSVSYRPTPDRSFILNQFPNHYVVLLNIPTWEGPTGVVAPGQQFVNLNVWTWGVEDLYQFRVPAQDFIDNYFGAIIARLR